MVRRGNSREGVEWVGGRLVAPTYVLEGGEPWRPDLVLWLELPEHLVVASAMNDPREGVPFGPSLLEAMRAPMIGPPRRPARIRVADEALAAEVRAAVPDIPVVVAPTPELDEVVEGLACSLDGDPDDASYLADGHVPAAAAAGLFEAAQALWTVAPWRAGGDQQVLRVDVPALGVEGACLSVIGSLGESRGFLLFPSAEAFDAFAELADRARRTDERPAIPTTMLSLEFQRGADLPSGLRREVARHGWPVAGPDAYPLPAFWERDGICRPLSAGETRLVAAVARALAGFFVRHGSVFAPDAFASRCETFEGDDGVAVTVTAPYEAHERFDPEEADHGAGAAAAPSGRPAAAPKVGRNDPCPCGSGRKYKRCHLVADRRHEAAAAAPPGAPTAGARAPVHDLDDRLVGDMLRFAEGRFGRAWLEHALDGPALPMEILVHWTLFHVPLHGKPLVDWFLAERGRSLSPAERGWLQAEQAAWLSVWEATAVDRGAGFTLTDLLTGEVRAVREVGASEALAPREALLARVVDHGGISVLCGVHPRPLRAPDAAEVVRRVRGRLRRKTAVPVERLRDEALGRFLLERWEEAVIVADVRAAAPLDLHNTDGDPIVLTVDRFEVAPGALERVARRLAALEDVQPPADDELEDDELVYEFVRAGNAMHADLESTSVGTARLREGQLRLETNSTRRADDIRGRVEAACGADVRHAGREQTTARELAERALAMPLAPPPAMPPEAQQLVLDLKRRHYAGWMDEPLPALGGLTPRAAVRTADGRRRVDVLLKDLESLEWRQPEAQRFDVRPLRTALGLDG